MVGATSRAAIRSGERPFDRQAVLTQCRQGLGRRGVAELLICGHACGSINPGDRAANRLHDPRSGGHQLWADPVTGYPDYGDLVIAHEGQRSGPSWTNAGRTIMCTPVTDDLE